MTNGLSANRQTTREIFQVLHLHLHLHLRRGAAGHAKGTSPVGRRRVAGELAAS
jgi:hypothetical protein